MFMVWIYQALTNQGNKMNTLFEQMSKPDYEPNLDIMTDDDELEAAYDLEMAPKILAERERLSALGFVFDA